MSARSARLGATKPAHPTVENTVQLRLREERTLWAMHIHDELTQSVTSAVLELQSLRRRIETDPDGAIASLTAVEEAIREDLQEIRAVLFELLEGRPHRDPPLTQFVEDLVARWKLSARVAIEGNVDSVPTAVMETTHAVLAEALANAAKHSGSPDVAVRVRASDKVIHVEVEDRGTGITDKDRDDDPHFGLRMIRARAERLGGTIDVSTTPEGGTRVLAMLPVRQQGDDR